MENGLELLGTAQLLRLGRPGVFEFLVSVLDHDDRRIDHRADGDGDATQRHDVRRQMHCRERNEGKQDRGRQHDDGDQGAAEMPEEDHANQADDDALLDELFSESVDRPQDQLGAVVDRDDPNSRRQGILQLRDLLFDPVDHGQRVLAVTHDDDAARGLALAVELRQPFAQVGAEFDGRHLVDG